MSKEAMKLALEALEGSTDKTLSIRAMKALQEALAEQPAQQEPFGYFRYDLRLDAWVQNRAGLTGTPFYTSPPARRKPLGYAGITIWGGEATVTKVFTEAQMEFAREPRSLIEAVVGQCLDELAAHGIKENT